VYDTKPSNDNFGSSVVSDFDLAHCVNDLTLMVKFTIALIQAG
jgi:hypothetical protein